jgi:O-succinylbenzoic acid--CoA ligase
MRAQLHPYKIKLRTPLRTSSGTILERRGWFLAVVDGRGHRGLGEAAPLPGWSHESALDVETQLRAWCQMPGPVPGTMCASAAHAVSSALWDLRAQSAGVPLAQLISKNWQQNVPVSHLVADARQAAACVQQGALCLKLKVARLRPSDDLDRIARVRAQVGPGITLRVDANRGWSLDTAKQMIPHLAELGVALIEEPVHHSPEMAALRGMGVLIAADESVRTPQDLARVIAANQADAVVLKPMLIGSLETVNQMIQTATTAKLKVMLTTTIDALVARRCVLHLAATIPPSHRLACGLMTGALLTRDLGDDRCHQGQVCVPDSTGLGLASVNPAALSNRTPQADRTPQGHAIKYRRHPLAVTAAARPDHPLLVADGRAWSAVQLQEAVAHSAAGISQTGVKAGDKVALIGPMSADWVIALHAIHWLGATAVPLPDNAPKQTLTTMLALTQPRVVLAHDPTRVAHEHVLPISTRGPNPAGEHFGGDADIQLLMLSSGTTGAPRAISLTMGQLRASAEASAKRLGHSPDDAWLCCLAGHHIGGISVLLRTLRYGTTAVVHERFEAEQVAKALDDGTVSQVSLVPTMLAAVLDARTTTPMPASVRLILVGGAPMPEHLLRRCRALKLPVAISWGMTELGSQAATRVPGDLRPAPDCGWPLPGTNVSTVDGRLVVAGEISPNGRWVTDDLGHLDEQGRVVVLGRADQTFVSGGENIDPREIELALEAHPGIQSAVVVPTYDTRWGQRPVAFLIPSAAVIPDESLRAHLHTRIERFKVPDSFHWRTDFPQSALGKVRRSSLADEAQALNGSDKLGRR